MKRFLLLSLLCFIPLSAKVIETKDISLLADYVDEGTLLIIDVDNTLIVPAQYLGTTRWGWNQTSRYEKQGMSHAQAMEAAARLFHKTWRLSEVKPVDERFPKLIEIYQEAGVPVIGLTNRHPLLGFITSDQLRSIGVDLTRGALRADDFALKGKRPAEYVEGVILVSDMGNKGDALISFLKAVQHKPKRIVYIDDRMKNVRRTESSVGSMGIDFVGIWYRAAEEWIEGFNQELADVQLRYLETILSDEDAEKLILAGVTR